MTSCARNCSGSRTVDLNTALQQQNACTQVGRSIVEATFWTSAACSGLVASSDKAAARLSSRHSSFPALATSSSTNEVDKRQSTRLRHMKFECIQAVMCANSINLLPIVSTRYYSSPRMLATSTAIWSSIMLFGLKGISDAV